MKVPKHIQKYVEGELMRYHINKKALSQAKQNIYAQQNADSNISAIQKSCYVTSSVENKVMYLMSNHNINRLEHTVTAIEDVLSELPEEYQKLIELRYFKAYSVSRVSSELSICVRNFFNWRDKAIHFFALRFGVI
jgi:RinA family phage transcriptional activator